MQSLTKEVIDQLFSIPAGVFETISDELFHPKQKYAPPKPECQVMIRGLRGAYHRQSVQLDDVGGQLYDMERDRNKYKSYSESLEKKLLAREKRIKSLEFKLREEIERRRRRR